MALTILDQKTVFLQAQLRILNTALGPSTTWLNNAPIPAEGALKDRDINEAMRKFNSHLRYHNRTVYPAPAIRHTAEQIDRLYWVAGAPDISYRGPLEDGEIGRDVDLHDSAIIAALPQSFEAPLPGVSTPSNTLEGYAEGSRYTSLRTRLAKLAERRATIEAKVEDLRRLREIMEAYRDPRTNVQPNLVVRDGELVQEMERMKLLMARVGEKVEGLGRR